MNILQKKTFITSFLVFIFLILGISGVLMFFHIFDDYTKLIHEITGLIFVLFVFVHIILNRQSIKIYAKQKVFLLAGIIILICAALLIFIGKNDTDIQTEILDKVLTAPITSSFVILNDDFEQTKIKLQEN
jgi:ABC-type uncharacterized transport system permease subunit